MPRHQEKSPASPRPMAGGPWPEQAQPAASVPYDRGWSTGAPARRPAVFATPAAPAPDRLGPGTNVPGAANQGREPPPQQSMSLAHPGEPFPAQEPAKRSAPLPPAGSTRSTPTPGQAVLPSARPGSLSP